MFSLLYWIVFGLIVGSIAKFFHTGDEPIGFFQMWNPKASGIFEYPKDHGSVDRSDVIFAKKFNRNKRQLIPEIISIHIDSEEMVKMGKNWGGRQTAKFNMKTYVNNLESSIRSELPILSNSNDYTPSLIDFLKENWVLLLGITVAFMTVLFYIGLYFFN